MVETGEANGADMRVTKATLTASKTRLKMGLVVATDHACRSIGPRAKNPERRGLLRRNS